MMTEAFNSTFAWWEHLLFCMASIIVIVGVYAVLEQLQGIRNELRIINHSDKI